ncbi:MAG TPA: F0F1 ATP synthase subunit gamma [Acidimicrobiales bacterium]|nr:F0F1 ATP synthase subunit gamma [Acidimicrobiales bacterium]
MAGGQERALRRRIRSVESTKKITKAMELISASQIIRAQGRVAAARPYSEQITEVIRNLAAAGAGGGDQPLLAGREEVRTVGFVVLTADRGLAGGYNPSVIRAAERALKAEVAAGRDYSLILVGKKAQAYFKFRKYKIDAAFQGFSDKPSYEDARAVAAEVLARFEDGRVDRVELVYTQFLSLASQRVQTRRFVPLETLADDVAAAGVGAGGGAGSANGGLTADYEFEPEPGEILGQLVPRYVEARLFAAMLDAAASEHAARQRAMKSATDNAEELIKVLARRMNRARQESITSEIMEIVGGAEALAQASSGEVDLLRDRMEDPDLFRHHERKLDRREHQENR